LLDRARKKGTTAKYSKWVVFWQQFCAEGDENGAYPEFTWNLAKWYEFQGYLKPCTEDRDLNTIRSALNRHFADNVGYRPALGTDVSSSIREWAADMDDMKRARGEEPGLNRVPCPEAAVQRVIELGERERGIRLGWLCLLTVQLLGWLRADSLAGLQKGDVVAGVDGRVQMAIRYMKNRPEFRVHPGMIDMAAPDGDSTRRHWRVRAAHVLRRGEQLYPRWETLLSDLVSNPNDKNGATASSVMTGWLRKLTVGVEIPGGAVVASHSWRETGAVSCHKANYDTMKMCEHGFWRDPNTMFTSYIRPFLHFPRSALLAELYDCLQ
jgi:hypothetical protein